MLFSGAVREVAETYERVDAGSILRNQRNDRGAGGPRRGCKPENRGDV